MPRIDLIEVQSDPQKESLLAVLRKFIGQRSGTDSRNYSDNKSYRSEARQISNDRTHALRIMREVELATSLTADDIVKQCGGGRLQISPTGSDDWSLDYVTGQYFPTEYRKAAARLLASALWDYKRRNNPKLDGNELRAYFLNVFGRTIANRYFN